MTKQNYEARWFTGDKSKGNRKLGISKTKFSSPGEAREHCKKIKKGNPKIRRCAPWKRGEF